MKKIVLILLFISLSLNARVMQDTIDNFKKIAKKHKYTYEIEEIKDTTYDISDYYLSLIDLDNKRVIKKYKLLHKPKLCQDSSNKQDSNDKCVELVYMNPLKYPLILFSSHVGAHSVTLDIYNPNINSKIGYGYLGNYGIDYKINQDSITVIYDKSCFENECPNHQIEFFSPFYKQTNAFYFDKDKLSLNLNMKKRVKHLAEFFNEYIAGFENYETNEPKKIRLIGDTDQKKAKVIKELLISYGVDKSFITISSKGEANKVYYKIW